MNSLSQGVSARFAHSSVRVVLRTHRAGHNEQGTQCGVLIPAGKYSVSSYYLDNYYTNRNFLTHPKERETALS